MLVAFFQRLFNRARYLVLVAVLGLSVTMIAAFIWALAKSGKLIVDLLDGGWQDDSKVVDLLEVIDAYLLAVVLLIVVVGLFELFVGTLDVPDWLHARSLEQLKKSIIDVLILFLGVKGVEGLLGSEDPLDALKFTAAVAVLIGALTFFRTSSKPAVAIKPQVRDDV